MFFISQIIILYSFNQRQSATTTTSKCVRSWLNKHFEATIVSMVTATEATAERGMRNLIKHQHKYQKLNSDWLVIFIKSAFYYCPSSSRDVFVVIRHTAPLDFYCCEFSCWWKFLNCQRASPRSFCLMIDNVIYIQVNHNLPLSSNLLGGDSTLESRDSNSSSHCTNWMTAISEAI